VGFNRRKMEDQRRQVAEKDAAARWATDAQVLEECRAANRVLAGTGHSQSQNRPLT